MFLCIYLFVSSSKVLVTMDNFRYLFIVLCQLHHYSLDLIYCIYILFDTFL